MKHSISEDNDGRLRFSVSFTSKYLIKTFMQTGKGTLFGILLPNVKIIFSKYFFHVEVNQKIIPTK